MATTTASTTAAPQRRRTHDRVRYQMAVIASPRVQCVLPPVVTADLLEEGEVELHLAGFGQPDGRGRLQGGRATAALEQGTLADECARSELSDRLAVDDEVEDAVEEQAHRRAGI